MYGKKVKFRFLFLVLIFLTVTLSVFLILQSLKDRNYFMATKILAKHDENYMPPEVKKAIGEE